MPKRLLFLPPLLLPALLAGCSKTPPPPAPNTPSYVRLASLLPLHPGWNEVRQLDTLLAHAASLPVNPSVPQNDLLDVPLSSRPSPFQGTIEAALPVRPDIGGAPLPDTNSVTQPAEARLMKLGAAFDAQNEGILDRERETINRKVKAEVAARRADLMAQPNLPGKSEPDPNAERRFQLQIQEIALETQVGPLGLFPPARGEAEKKLKAVRDELKRLAPKPADASNAQNALSERIDKEVAAFAREKLTATERTVAERRKMLAAKTQEILAGYRKQLQMSVEMPIPLAETTTLPASASTTLRLPSLASPTQVRGQIVSTSASAPAASALPTASSRAALLAQRARLVSYLTDDVRRRVDRLAAENHWTIQYAPSPGRTDVTPQAADKLNAEFKP